jgi:hypothetical protein
MTHPLFRVTSFEQTGTYRLKVHFNDGLSREIDFALILEGEIYGPLRAPAEFACVALDPEVHTLIWPSGADFDPAILHDWPQHEAAFISAAQRWSEPACN